jgi:hypothetical protein
MRKKAEHYFQVSRKAAMDRHQLVLSRIILITVIVWGMMASGVVAAENRGHRAPAEALPKELKSVNIKDYFLPGNTKEVGVIQATLGHVVVARSDLSQAYFAANGDKLHEQDIVLTLKDSKCRLKFLNNDIATLGDDTRITIRAVSGNRNAPGKKTNLYIARGKAMFYAIHLLSDKGTTMTVESPTSIADVRGTKFGMEVTKEGETTIEILPVIIADTSGDWGRLLMTKADHQPGLTTTVHGFDGLVTVTSTVNGRTQSVGAGLTVSASSRGIGALMPTPPLISLSFKSATNVLPPSR